MRVMFMRVLATVAAAAVVVTAGCESAAPKPPGAVEVFLTTETAEVALFTFGVAVDSASPRSVSSALRGSFVITGLAAGAHLVVLTGLPANCTSGSDSRVAEVPAGDTVTVGFNVKCVRTTGDLNVTASTTGVELDPDGYTVRVDGVGKGTIAAGGTTMLPRVEAGTRTVELIGVASNCTIAGGAAPRVIDVTAGSMITVSFSVTCVSTRSILRFTTSTSGADLDPDGYLITIGSAPPLRIGGFTLLNYPAGPIRIRIGDIEPNCTLSGLADRTFNSVGGDTVVVAIQTVCAPIPAGTVGFATTDAPGDTLPMTTPTAPRGHDMIGLTGRYAPGWLILTVKFANTVRLGVSPGDLNGWLDFDVDENAATGIPSFARLGGSDAVQGSDFAVSIFGIVSTSASILTLPATTVGSARVITRAAGDSLMVYIPMAKLGGDDGNLTITGIFGTVDRPTDIIPNTGVIVARTTQTVVSAARAPLPPRPPMSAAMQAAIESLRWPKQRR